MSTTDEARLDAVDRRGRAAARTLLDDLTARAARTLVAEDARPAGTAGTGTHTDNGTQAGSPDQPEWSSPDTTVIDLGKPPARKHGRPARRRWLGAAAVVAVLALAGGVITAVTGDDDDDPSAVADSGEGEHFLATTVPDRFEAVSTFDIPDPAGAGYSAEVAVYGDPDSDDPWAAFVSVVHLVADEELLGGPPSGGEPVTVAGHDARLNQTEGIGTEQVWQVEWDVDDGRLFVAGALSPDAVLAAAEAATTEPAIDTSGLPDGYAELARGPYTDSVLFMSLFEGEAAASDGDAATGSGLAVVYADPADNGQVRPAVVVASRPGPASAVDLLRLSFDDAEAITVRGHPAVIGRGREPAGSAGEAGVVAVQWAEPDGQLVSVVGFGVAEDEVLEVAEGLRPASPEQIAGVREEHAVAAPRTFGDVPEGHVVVASGDSLTGRWRVVADAGADANIGALAVERVSGVIGSTTSTTGERVELPVDVSIDVGDGTVVIWGVVSEDAASVSVEAAGVEPIALDIHQVEGWSTPVVADSFPDDHFMGADGTVSVVARDAEGREVGRNDETGIGPR